MEGAVGVDGGVGGVAQDGGGLGAYQIQQHGALLGGLESCEAGGDGGGVGCWRVCRLAGGECGGLGQVGQEGAGAVEGEGGQETVPCHVGDDEGRLVVADGRFKRGDRWLGRHHDDPAARELLGALLVQHAALCVPGTPGHGGGPASAARRAWARASR